ncbi:MAG TPA: sulfatase [Tepidisphaeraceae bacterium]|jgi:arylsulfatase A-like enzyme
MNYRALPLVLLLVLLPGTLHAQQPPRYNVLFLISDDLRTECTCYGGLAKTPNVDALAAAGVRFDRAYCQFPLCNPSRSSMLTGRYPTSTGVLGNRTAFRTAHPDWVTLPQHFKDNGYISYRCGKIFHGGIDDPKAWSQRGDAPDEPRTQLDADVFRPLYAAMQVGPTTWPMAGDEQLTQAQRSDRWIVLSDDVDHPENRVADQTIQFMRRNRDKPFFIGCGFSKPHSPPTAPKRFYDLYDVERIPLPPDYAPRPTVPEGFPRGAIRPRNADLFINRDSTPQTAREMIRAYLASCSWMDWNVGRVIAALDELGLRERTIIVFWGDHGYQLGEKGKWSKAGSLFEAGARVPFIVIAPGAIGNGQSCARVVEMVDLYPTLVELCGLPKPDGLEGRTIASLLNDPKQPWDHPAYTCWSEDGQTLTGVAVRTERWRYAEYTLGGAMLLDTENDPHEMKNLAGDTKYTDHVAQLSPLVRKYAEKIPGSLGR